MERELIDRSQKMVRRSEMFPKLVEALQGVNSNFSLCRILIDDFNVREQARDIVESNEKLINQAKELL